MKSIEDIKNSIGERDSAVQKAEDGAVDLKKTVEDLSKHLDECEREYQVNIIFLLPGNKHFYIWNLMYFSP